jgi:hypothetical protein
VETEKSHDQMFKELIREFFLDFIELFFPELAQSIDPKSIVFVDKQLFVSTPTGESYDADLVVKARLLGQEVSGSIGT